MSWSAPVSTRSFNAYRRTGEVDSRLRTHSAEEVGCSHRLVRCALGLGSRTCLIEYPKLGKSLRGWVCGVEMAEWVM